MTVLLTGAGGQLGTIVNEYLSARGCDVVAADRAVVDLSNADDCVQFIAQRASAAIGIVHLVGGINAGRPITDTSPADVDAMLQLNLVTTFNVLRGAIPVLIANGGGSIVTIGAKAVLQPDVNRSAYAASKAAVVSLTLSAAEEGRPHGVRANCIVPDVIRTAANLEWGSAEQISTWVHPQEIASTIFDLLQPESAITGTVIPMLTTTRRRR